MPTYLVVSQSSGGGVALDHVTAADAQAAALAVRNQYAQGMSIAEGQRAVILVGLIEFDATGTVTPNAVPASAQSTYSARTKQPAIANLAAGANVATVVTKVNAILAMLRADGRID